eukprot:759445-Prymnesium_polylepis.1
MADGRTKIPRETGLAPLGQTDLTGVAPFWTRGVFVALPPGRRHFTFGFAPARRATTIRPHDMLEVERVPSQDHAMGTHDAGCDMSEQGE